MLAAEYNNINAASALVELEANIDIQNEVGDDFISRTI
jgi:hypothetical protein